MATNSVNNNTTEKQETTTTKRKSDLSKISITKPNNKKKAIGTALFGCDINGNKSKRDVQVIIVRKR